MSALRQLQLERQIKRWQEVFIWRVIYIYDIQPKTFASIIEAITRKKKVSK